MVEDRDSARIRAISIDGCQRVICLLIPRNCVGGDGMISAFGNRRIREETRANRSAITRSHIPYFFILSYSLDQFNLDSPVGLLRCLVKMNFLRIEQWKQVVCSADSEQSTSIPDIQTSPKCFWRIFSIANSSGIGCKNLSISLIQNEFWGFT